jgi:hypothetical protein
MDAGLLAERTGSNVTVRLEGHSPLALAGDATGMIFR